MNAYELKCFRESLEKNAGIPGAGFVKGTYNVLRHPVRSLRSAKDFVLWGKRTPTAVQSKLGVDPNAGSWAKRFKGGVGSGAATGIMAGTIFTGGAIIGGVKQPRLLSDRVVNRSYGSLGGR